MKHRMGILATCLVLGLLLAAPSLQAEEEPAGQQAFVTLKCNLCHAVSTVGIEAKTKSEKLKGPDLVNMADEFDAETMAAFIRKELERDGKTHKKSFKGTDEELQVIVDWLLEQKS